jgi:hypothetical protein
LSGIQNGNSVPSVPASSRESGSPSVRSVRPNWRSMLPGAAVNHGRVARQRCPETRSRR